MSTSVYENLGDTWRRERIKGLGTAMFLADWNADGFKSVSFVPRRQNSPAYRWADFNVKCPPKISTSRSILDLVENIPVGTRIDHLSATDPEQAEIVAWSITTPDTNFGITDSGAIFVAQPLDFRQQELHTFKVIAINEFGRASNPASVIVRVHADDSPQFGTPESLLRDGVNAFYDSVLADLDGDGDLDVAAASSYGDGIRWYENVYGDGHYFKQHKFPGLLSRPEQIEAADVDSDNDIDLIVSTGRELFLYRNEQHKRHFTRSLLTDSMETSERFTVGDIDGDGDPDLVTTRFLLVLENVDGNFSVVAQDFEHDGRAERAFITDVDGDQDQDLLIPTRTGHISLYWYENEGGEFDRDIQLVTRLWSGAEFVTVADLDADQDTDFVTTNYRNDLVWLENVGDEYISHFLENAYPEFLMLDLDSDGDEDIVALNEDNALVLFENRLADSGEFARHAIPVPGGRTPKLDMGDIDGDGDVDILVGQSSRNNRIYWVENRNGRFEADSVHSLFDSPHSPVAADIADFNRDGTLDVVVGNSDGTVTWYDSVDPTTSAVHMLIPYDETGPVHDLHTVDTDGDGDADVISASDHIRWLENTGVGEFVSRDVASSVTEPGQLEIDDFNGDTWPDLVVASIKTGHMVLLENNMGDGTWNETILLKSEGPAINTLNVVDFDTDNDLDIVFSSDDQLAWLENNDGTFVLNELLMLRDPLSDIQLLDVAGDPRPELFAIVDRTATNEILMLEQTDAGLNRRMFSSENSISSESRIRSFEIADANNDGSLDLLLGTGRVKLIDDFLAEPSFSLPVATGRSMSADVLEVADLNGDGLLDLVVGSTENSRLVQFTQQSTTPSLAITHADANADYFAGEPLPEALLPTEWTTQQSLLRMIRFEVDAAVNPEGAIAELIWTGRENPPEEPDIIVAERRVFESIQLLQPGYTTLNVYFPELEDGIYDLRIRGLRTYEGRLTNDLLLQGDMENGLFQLTGDWNGDGSLSAFDFPALSYWFGESAKNIEFMDLNGDGGVSIFDIAPFAARFAESMPVLHVPVAGGDSGETISSTPTVLDVLNNDVDLDRDPLTIIGLVAGLPGEPNDNANAAISHDGSRVTYDPGQGFVGTDYFSYIVSDGSGRQDEALVRVAVGPPAKEAAQSDAEPSLWDAALIRRLELDLVAE